MRKAGLHDEKAAFAALYDAMFEGVTEDDFYRENYSAGA